MPITPIETAAMAPKSQEASIYKHQENQKPLNEQTVIQHQFNNELKHNSQQTVKTAKGDSYERRYDAKEKGNTSYSESKQNKKKKKQEETTKDGYRPGSIDIRI
jgi:hypothetical protein